MLRVAAGLALALTAFAPAAARELHWRELDVTATLAADGTLTVSERHAMVFTGDWNGGERVFRLARGHDIQFTGVFRRDRPGDDWRPLRQGSLDRLDRWDWTASDTVRWRSRLPSDPQFDRTEIGYRLDYRLRNILRQRDGVWILDHDFAFPDRVGQIERFALTLELAPEWRAPDRFVSRVEGGPLQPGESHVVTVDLRYVGAGEPAHAGPRLLPAPLRRAAVGFTALGALALIAWAIVRERGVGRLRPLPPLDGVDRAWIEANVLALPPEEVGAAWDDTVAAAEVAAMLARLQLEGKLASRVEERGFWIFRGKVLHLSLLVARQELTATERALIDGLFPQGAETSTELLRKHYRASGFDPAAKIRKKLLDAIGRWRGFGAARPRPGRAASALLIVAGAVTLVVATVVVPLGGPPATVLGLALVALWIPAFAAAFVLRDRVRKFRTPLIVIAISQLLALLAMALVATIAGVSIVALGGAALLHLGLTRSVATAMQTRQGAERIARRRELARARGWFAAELDRREPQLDDAWLPYLIAFGLAPEMDRWFRLFGGAGVAAVATPHWSGSGGSVASGGGWTGGGGAFGGAGATAAWTSAATAMSAGVAAASSSSGGGGGGGGGGGSSGGGGGGGW